MHTYGHLIPLGEKGKNSAQHKGIGKMLMAEAEKIVRSGYAKTDYAKKCGIKKIAVISGVGVREYYKKMGYSKSGTYMVKYIV